MSGDPLEVLRAQAAAALFPVDGTLHAPGLGAPVTVTRDGRGIPSITAATLEDLWFAQGLVTAGERLFQLDLTLRAASGRLSEVFGRRTLQDDRFTRTIGLHLAGARYVASWTDEDHAMHARFREGVHAWLSIAPALPIEYQLLQVTPRIPDAPEAWAACFAYLAWGLSNNLEVELLRARVRERLGEEAMRRLVPPTSARTPSGSNNWVVSGTRSASGMPLLANDPHLLAQQPGAWIPFGLHAPGYEAQGVAFAFSPGIVLGATSHHAWGATNVTGDVQDLFIVDDGDVTGIRHEPIVVRGEEEPAPHEVRETRHGPILDRLPVGDRATIYEDVEGTYALRWVGAEVGLRPSTVLRFATAGDFGTFRLAVGEVACPGQNFVYADVEGHIGLQVTGLHPRRRHGDGSVPAADHGWDGWIPTEELPWALDPPEGIIVTANDGLAHAAFGPHVLSADYHQPTRARRIRELLAAGSRHDVASFGAIQRDTVSLAARETVPLLIDAVNAGADVGAVTGHRRAALDLLAGWDHDLAADSPAAALYEVWSEALARRVLRARMGEALFRVYTASTETWKAAVMPALLRDPAGWLDPGTVGAALDDALDELGDPIPAWGALHRLRLAHPLAELPGLEPLFVAVDEPAAGDELTVCVTAMDHVAGRHVAVTASWRAVFDLADLAAAAWTVPSGVSGDPASPHWCDQAAAHREGAPGAGLSPISTLGVSPS